MSKSTSLDHYQKIDNIVGDRKELVYARKTVSEAWLVV